MCFGDKKMIQKIMLDDCLDTFGNEAMRVLVETEDHHGHIAVIPYANEVEKSVDEIKSETNQIALTELSGCDVFRQSEIDQKLQELFKKSGENKAYKRFFLGISMAVTRIAACSSHRELFEYLGGISGRHLPNLIISDFNGARWILPRKDSFKKDVKMCEKVCRKLESKQKTISQKMIFETYEKNGYRQEMNELKQENEMFESEKMVWVDALDFCCISEVIHHIREAKANGKIPILEGESFSTEDSYLADLAVGLNLKYVSFGKPLMGANNIKYNRLMEIESSFV